MMGPNSKRRGNEMAMRILWPNLPAEFVPVVRDAVGPGFETEFCAAFPDVTDEQWANADAIVGPARRPVHRQAAQVPHFREAGGRLRRRRPRALRQAGHRRLQHAGLRHARGRRPRHCPDADAGQEHRVSRRRVARRSPGQLAPRAQPVRPSAVGLHLRRGRHGSYRHRRGPAGQGLRHGRRLP